jgi:hypothetical protein
MSAREHRITVRLNDQETAKLDENHWPSSPDWREMAAQAPRSRSSALFAFTRVETLSAADRREVAISTTSCRGCSIRDRATTSNRGQLGAGAFTEMG